MTANQAGWNRPQPLFSVRQASAFVVGKLNHVLLMPAVLIIILYQTATVQPPPRQIKHMKNEICGTFLQRWTVCGALQWFSLWFLTNMILLSVNLKTLLRELMHMYTIAINNPQSNPAAKMFIYLLINGHITGTFNVLATLGSWRCQHCDIYHLCNRLMWSVMAKLGWITKTVFSHAAPV